MTMANRLCLSFSKHSEAKLVEFEFHTLDPAEDVLPKEERKPPEWRPGVMSFCWAMVTWVAHHADDQLTQDLSAVATSPGSSIHGLWNGKKLPDWLSDRFGRGRAKKIMKCSGKNKRAKLVLQKNYLATSGIEVYINDVREADKEKLKELARELAEQWHKYRDSSDDCEFDETNGSIPISEEETLIELVAKLLHIDAAKRIPRAKSILVGQAFRAQTADRLAQAVIQRLWFLDRLPNDMPTPLDVGKYKASFDEDIAQVHAVTKDVDSIVRSWPPLLTIWKDIEELIQRITTAIHEILDKGAVDAAAAVKRSKTAKNNATRKKKKRPAKRPANSKEETLEQIGARLGQEIRNVLGSGMQNGEQAKLTLLYDRLRALQVSTSELFREIAKRS